VAEIEQNPGTGVVFQFREEPHQFLRTGAGGGGSRFEKVVECGVASKEAVEC
jgi:hypothetical protein